MTWITEEIINQVVDSKDPQLLHWLDLFLNDPYYSFEPLPDRPEVFSQQTSFVKDRFPGIACALGGNGSGKTFCAAYKVVNFLLNTPAPKWMADYIVCSQNASMCANIWRQHLSRFLPENYIEPGGIIWKCKADQSPSAVVLKTNNQHRNWVIRFMSYEQGKEAFRAYSVGGFWADEPCPEDVWQELNWRCREFNLPGGKTYTLTPINCYLPTLQNIYNNRDKHEDRWKFYHLSTKENKYLPAEVIKQLEAETPDADKATRLLGFFSNPQGVLYPEYNPDRHVIEPFAIPAHWKKYRSIDYGTKHPTVCLWIAASPEGEYIVYDEWYTTAPMLIEDKVKAIMDKQPWDERDPSYCMTIADSEDAQQRLEFSAKGLHTVPADKSPNSVFDGIERVNSLLKDREGVTKIKIFKHCDMLRRQMASCRWADGPKAGRNPGKYKPEPYKMDDDAADALRYFIYKVHHVQTKPWAAVDLPRRTSVFTYGKR